MIIFYINWMHFFWWIQWTCVCHSVFATVIFMELQTLNIEYSGIQNQTPSLISKNTFHVLPMQ